jgi:hypothetical protein
VAGVQGGSVGAGGDSAAAGARPGSNVQLPPELQQQLDAMAAKLQADEEAARQAAAAKRWGAA